MIPDPKQLVVSIALLFVFGGAAAAEADKPAQVGVSAAVRGDVTLIRKAAGTDDRQVQSGEPIFVGDAIKTDSVSGMQMLTLGGSVLSFGPVGEYSIESFASGTFRCVETGEFLSRGRNQTPTALRRCESAKAGRVSVRVQRGNFEYTSNGGDCDESPTLTLHLPTAIVRSFGEHVVVAVRGEAGLGSASDEAFGRLTEVPKWMQKARYMVVLPDSKYQRNKTCRTIAVTPVPAVGANREPSPKDATSIDRSILSVRGTAVFGYDNGKISAPISVRLRY